MEDSKPTATINGELKFNMTLNMENFTKPSASAINDAADKRKKEELKRDLKGILIENVVHCMICIYICIFATIKLPHAASFLVNLIFIFIFGVLFNYVMIIVVVRGGDSGGDKVLELCKSDYVAYVLTLHFGTHARVLQLLQRLRKRRED